MNSHSLFIVPTPIGNLEDITIRAIRVLKEVDFIIAEDTRKTGQLLKHFEISTKMISNHLHNEHRIASSIIEKLLSGQSAALVSDAGTPAISDPGFFLVREAVKNNIAITTLPGPTAFVPALVNSALPSERFCFEGFLPHKKGRKTKLEAIMHEERTMIFYESPHRIIKLLEEFILVFGPERRGSISREISKVFEETRYGTISELLIHFSKNTIKGEFVIVIEGKKN